MEKATKGSFDLGFVIGIALLVGVAATLVLSGAPSAALSAWIVLAEISYLVWAAWGESPHRGDAAVFAFRMHIQAAVRVIMWTALAVIGLVTASVLPAVSPIAIISAFDPAGSLGGGATTIAKLAILGSIMLAAIRLKRVQLRGTSPRSLADGTYCKHSVRLPGTLSEVAEALDERLAYLALQEAPRFSGWLRKSRVQVVRNEEDGRPIARLYFSNFPLRATISLRQIDQRHTDLRVWFRVRGGYLLSELFPNPVNVARLQDYLDEAVIEPVRASLDGALPASPPRPTAVEPQAGLAAAAA